MGAFTLPCFRGDRPYLYIYIYALSNLHGYIEFFRRELWNVECHWSFVL